MRGYTYYYSTYLTSSGILEVSYEFNMADDLVYQIVKDLFRHYGLESTGYGPFLDGNGRFNVEALRGSRENRMVRISAQSVDVIRNVFLGLSLVRIAVDLVTNEKASFEITRKVDFSYTYRKGNREINVSLKTDIGRIEIRPDQVMKSLYEAKLKKILSERETVYPIDSSEFNEGWVSFNMRGYPTLGKFIRLEIKGLIREGKIKVLPDDVRKEVNKKYRLPALCLLYYDPSRGSFFIVRLRRKDWTWTRVRHPHVDSYGQVCTGNIRIRTGTKEELRDTIIRIAQSLEFVNVDSVYFDSTYLNDLFDELEGGREISDSEVVLDV